MEETEYLDSGNAWFKERLHGDDGRYWKRARRLFLFNNDLSSALNLFQFDYKAIKTISRPDGVTIIGFENTVLDPNEKREHRPGQSWTDDAKNSIRTLLDRIVTQWKPSYMYHSKINIRKLHDSLTPEPLQHAQTAYDLTGDDIETFNVRKALALYQACLVPLHYHELWSEIVSDFRNVETKLEERETVINIERIYSKTTLDEEDDTALIFGTNRVLFSDNYKPLSKKLGLFDLVLINIDTVRYFGMVVHAEQIKVKAVDEEKNADNNHHNLRYDILTTIGIYVSRACSTAYESLRDRDNDKKLVIQKLSNITSSRRVISAVHNIHGWSQHRSILKPTIDDIYFQQPQDYDPLNRNFTDRFNSTQSKTIDIAECMFDDIQERMHLVHGPPGTGKSRTIAGIVVKLLPKLLELGRKRKILLCAPSNNACDELSRRILDEFRNMPEPPKRGTLVRIGCRPPDDYHLCDYFLDFMILQDVVDELKKDQKPSSNIAKEVEGRIMRHAKIVISTLNYCGSTRMHHLKSSTEFLIIDEASQSLEGDCLLPLRFECTKVMLVGDPRQLPPCVLSDAGNTYGLSQSLYVRLFSTFEQYPNGPISMLDTQYRMHPEICRFPSEYFYSGRLLTSGCVERGMRQFTLKPLYLYNILTSPHGADDAKSSHNIGEAKHIQAFCELLIAHLAEQATAVPSDSEADDDNDDNAGSSTTSSSNSIHDTDEDSIRGEDNERHFQPPLPLDDPRSIAIQQRIAVITPYKAQVRILRSYLPRYIETMTVDSSQGKEKDIVIISCVRSGGTIGFLNDMNRVNVMITRSKFALYVFGNLTQLAGQHECWKAFVDHAQAKHIICNVNTMTPILPYC